MNFSKLYLWLKSIDIFEMLIFFIFAIIIMNKAFLHPNIYYIGDNGDSFDDIWYIGNAWGHNIFDVNLFISHLQNYPLGINLMSNGALILYSLLIGWIQNLFGVVVLYNILYFANIMLIMIFTYKIFKQLSVSRTIAVIGSLLSVLLPYLTAQSLGHPTLYLIYPIIGIEYLIIKFFFNQTKKKHYYLFGLLIVVLFYTNLELIATFLFFLFINFIIYMLYFRKLPKIAFDKKILYFQCC